MQIKLPLFVFFNCNVHIIISSSKKLWERCLLNISRDDLVYPLTGPKMFPQSDSCSASLSPHSSFSESNFTGLFLMLGSNPSGLHLNTETNMLTPKTALVSTGNKPFQCLQHQSPQV